MKSNRKFVVWNYDETRNFISFGYAAFYTWLMASDKWDNVFYGGGEWRVDDERKEVIMYGWMTIFDIPQFRDMNLVEFVDNGGERDKCMEARWKDYRFYYAQEINAPRERWKEVNVEFGK